VSKYLKNYATDVLDELDVSPFEYIDTFRVRDYLEENKIKFTEAEKKELKRLDLILLSRANEFYDYLKSTKCWGSQQPIENWWWHLDKIVSGILKVEI
jgi:hypothetical protein